jgi:hypothetical protein
MKKFKELDPQAGYQPEHVEKLIKEKLAKNAMQLQHAKENMNYLYNCLYEEFQKALTEDHDFLRNKLVHLAKSVFDVQNKNQFIFK